ncbi:hypothetical protein BC831DRAFT_512603 [Entophlyctis helioformis]|nr:hypothetical protein BC831DRAFT_512603 [Entophlyctis helioformis]
MDWLLFTRSRACLTPTYRFFPWDGIVPTTLPSEPRRCISYNAQRFVYTFTDASKSAVALSSCSSVDCSSNCSVVETAVLWDSRSAQPCTNVYVPVSAKPVLAIDDINAGLAAAGAVGLVGNGPSASAYHLRLMFLETSSCSGVPSLARVHYLFETCGSYNSSHYARTVFDNGLADPQRTYDLLACTDSACRVGCRTVERPPVPALRGAAADCSIDDMYGNSLSYEARALTNSSQFYVQGSLQPSPVPPGPTRDAGSSATTAPFPPAAIAGIAVGAVVVVAVGILALLLARRRRQSAAARNKHNSDDSSSDSDSTTANGKISQPDAMSPPKIVGILPSANTPVTCPADASLERSLPPSYEMAAHTPAHMTKVHAVPDHDDQTYGLMELPTEAAIDRDNQTYGVMEITDPAALDRANQQYGVMEANYRRS